KNRVVNLINKKQRMKYGGDITFLDNEILDSLVDKNCDFESKVAACSDVEDLIKQLPPRWQDLCEKLKVYNVAEVSEITGLSRTTIYKILKRIGEKFPHLKTYIS
ncbi:sigma-70 RNA polymerase sigma factor region 4 domain-containing protein, partial [Wolbachia pipientis]